MKISDIKNLLLAETKISSALLIMLGIISSLAFAPLFIFPLAIIYIITIALLVENIESKKSLFKKIWALSFGHFVGGCYWICYSLAIDLAKFWWMIPITISLLPAYLAIFPAIAAVLSQKYLSRQSYFFIIGFAAVWCFAEIIRSKFLTGFPWNLMGYSLSFNTVFLQMASVGGIYLLSFIVVVISLLLFYAIKERSLDKIILLLVIVSGCYFYGEAQIRKPTFFTNQQIRLVQANIKQELKWDDQYKLSGMLEHLKLSNNAQEGEWIIWPEAAVPYILTYTPNLIETISAIIPRNGKLITGSLRAEGNNEHIKLWNSLFAVTSSKQIENFYDKRHLVPFGEYIPMRAILPIDKITPGQIDYQEGKGNPIINIGNFKVLPLICYEAIITKHNFIKNQNIDLILNLTNDGWFGDSFGPYQHFHMARVRAIETGLPLIRVANTGISAVIDGYGRILQQTELGKQQVISSGIPKKIETTIYSRYIDENVIYIIFIKIMLLIGIARSLYEKKTKNNFSAAK